MPPDSPEFRQHVGLRIKNFREACGMTQEAVARRMQLLGYTSYIQPRQAEAEAGRRPVSLREAVCHARIYGITLDALVGNPEL